MRAIIHGYSREGGVRSLEREIGTTSPSDRRRQRRKRERRAADLTSILGQPRPVSPALCFARDHRDYDHIPEETRNKLQFVWLERAEDAVAARWNRCKNKIAD